MNSNFSLHKPQLQECSASENNGAAMQRKERSFMRAGARVSCSGVNLRTEPLSNPERQVTASLVKPLKPASTELRITVSTNPTFGSPRLGLTIVGGETLAL